ncbi:hypothetical protein BD779DRAFT_1672159 [Infundibulicybe gibba]|nr:hypothetical protein BD779DRAFT_1672159 [Infundibulicybe gibba]
MSPELHDTESIPLMNHGEGSANHDEILVNTDTDDWTPAPRTPYRQKPQWYSPLLSTFVFLAFLVSILSTLWTTAQVYSSVPHQGSERVNVSSLRRPSIYLGLDRVEDIKISPAVPAPQASPSQTHEGSHGTPLSGMPRGIVRLNSRHPTTSYPPDGWVLLTSQDTALMEFHPQPRENAHCQIGSFFPTRGDLGDKMLSLEGHDLTIDVQLIAPSYTLSSSETWNSRPPTIQHLGVLKAAFGVVAETPTFPCPDGLPIVVELSCSDEDCRVEYENSAVPTPILGIFLIQLGHL